MLITIEILKEIEKKALAVAEVKNPMFVPDNYDYTYFNIKEDSLRISFINAYARDSDERQEVFITMEEINSDMSELIKQKEEQERIAEENRRIRIKNMEETMAANLLKREKEEYERLKVKFEGNGE